MSVRKLTSEQRLSRAIDIMEALYAAGENGMTRHLRTENRAHVLSANAAASAWSSPVMWGACYRCA